MVGRIRRKGTELFYYLYFGMLLFLEMMQSPFENFNDGAVHDIVQIIALLCALCCFVLKKYSITDLIIVSLLNIIGIVCYLSSGYTTFFTLILAITLQPEENMDKTLRFMLGIKLVIFSAVVIASQMGIISTQMVEVAKGTYSVSRSALGFGHPNRLALQSASILLLYLCTRQPLQNYHVCIAVVATVIIFAVTQCRTAVLLLTMMCLLLSLRNNQRVQKLVFGIFPYIHVIVIVGFGLLLLLYGRLGSANPLVQLINGRIFNGRVGLAYNGLQIYPTTLFGKTVDESIALRQLSYFVLDNGQVYVWLTSGVLGFATYSYLIQSAMKHILLRKNYVYASAAMMLLIWTLYEAAAYYIAINFIYLFATIPSARNDVKSRKGKQL